MPIEFTFVPGSDDGLSSEGVPAPFFFDARWSAGAMARIEDAGFHGIVIDGPAGLLTNFDLAADAAASTASLGIVLTHWAGVVAPTVAARQLAALDAACGGRLALRILPDGGTGGGEELQASHVALWQRTDEYLTLLKRLWSNDRPFDHEGAFYSVRGGFVHRKGPRGFAIPIRMGGRSGTALRVAGRHADVFELAPASPEDVRLLMARLRAAASRCGRADKVRFALPVRFSSGAAPIREDAIHVGASPEEAVRVLRDYAEAGVSEFMVHGAHGIAAVRTFAGRLARLLGDRAVARAEPTGFASTLRGSGQAAGHPGRG